MTQELTRPSATDAVASHGVQTRLAGGVSRRHVVQGVLWATPAVLIATAVPAAAASAPLLGGLLLTSPSGYQNTSALTVSTHVSFVGGPPPNSYHPVSPVRVTISVPTARVAAGAGTTASAGWTYTSRTDGPTNTVFTYTWNSSLSSSATITGQLVAVLPKNSTRTAFTVSVQSTGTSNGQSVQSGTSTVAIGAYSVLTIGTAIAAERDSWGTNPRYIRVTGSVRNNSGSPSNNTAPVVGMVARVTVPTAAVGGTGTVAVSTGPWSYTGVTTSGSNTIYTFTYTGGSLAASGSAVNFGVRTPMISGIYTPTPSITCAFEGRSPTAAGALTSVSGSDTLEW